MKEEELTKKIVMFRTELERQQTHSGENLGIKSLFDTMCSYFGEQNREIESLQQQNKAYKQENKKLREQNKAWEKQFESELDWFKPSITLVKPEKGVITHE
jgi:cell shape-determining protein MreC